jgi:acetoin utilization protein AcuC
MKKIREISSCAGNVWPSCKRVPEPARRRALQKLAAGWLLAAAPAGFGQSPGKSMKVFLYVDEGLAAYGFPEGHPLGIDRQGAFLREANAQGLVGRAQVMSGRAASAAEIGRFHTREYVDFVAGAEQQGLELLDNGDTPVFPGVYPASAYVVGAALDGLGRVMSGECRRTLQPIGGLHHAMRGAAAGFCVFNDLGVVIETLRSQYDVKRVGYIDIDVHHGDGVYYPFEDDPELILADIHQDGHTLFPGTGHEHETGSGAAKGTKLNIALRPGAGDREFMQAWERVEAHFEKWRPEFLVFQCGADGLKGDPLARLEYSPQAHAHAARRLCALAEKHAKGRIMAFGGGGYNRANLGRAWSAVLKEFVG